MKLHEIAHSRAGDKGNISTLSLIPFDENHYELLCEKVTIELVRNNLSEHFKGKIKRFELPNISALQFVCYNALAGGVTTSLALDTHGKCLSSALLEIEI